MSRIRTILGLAVLVAGIAPPLACERAKWWPDRPLTETDAARMYGPRKIEVLPFTRPKSFDADPVPDGLEVSLRSVDDLGDPVKAYGTFLFELHRYRNASGNRAGELLESWTQSIASVADQQRFWDRVTSTYTFQLTWERGDFPPPNKKYVLHVSFQTPGGERLFADYVFDFQIDRKDIQEGLSRPGS